MSAAAVGERPIRLVATDIDGTLLRSDGTVSERTRAAVGAASAAGLLVAFVTGRPPRWLDEIATATGHQGVAVGANGAVLYDLVRGDIVSMHVLEPRLLRAVTTELRAAYPAVSFAMEYREGMAAEAGYVHDWQVNPRADRRGRPIPAPQLLGPDELVSRPAMKLLAKMPGANPDEFLADASALLAGWVSVTSSSSRALLEIGPPGVTKASGLAELAARHQLRPSEVAAIGDMPNDIPMLQWAGRSYAVANAHPAAKAAADEVVVSNDEDAVAVLIESLL